MNPSQRSSYNKHSNSLSASQEVEGDEQVWTDDQSNISSDCSHSSYISRTHEWSPFIADNSLFYVKFDLVYHSKPIIFDDDLFFRNEYKRLSIRKKENILSKFGQREKNKHKLFKVSVIDTIKKEQLNGLNKEIIISIAPKKNTVLKDILPLTETILGITTSLFPDGRKLMVDKIKDYSVFNRGKLVKSKDWIKSIDTEIVTVDNLESLLESSTKIPTIIKITFFEMVEHDIANAIEIKITSLMDLIQSQETLFNKDDIQTMSSNDLIFSMIYISNEYTQNDELDVKFCYPARDNNPLYNSKGSFVTLNSIFNSSFETKTLMTNLKIRNVLYYTTYNFFEDGILLFGFNSKYSSLFSVKQKSEQICRLLNILYHDSSIIFNKPVELQTELMQLCELIRHSIKTHRSLDKFEKTFHQPHFIPLPKEIQLRIDDALGELEAMDYRNWNDELVDLFCDVTIIGCCLYYNQYLVCSHINGSFLMDVEAVLKNFGIFEVISTTNIKNLAIWRKFYPTEYCEYKFHESNDAYLMLVCIGHLLMVVILEVPINTNHNKSLSRYIDEIQDMLEYFKSTGIENLVRIWIDSNRRPQCISTSASKQECTVEEQRTTTRNHDEESNASSSIKNHPLKEDGINDHDDDDDSDWGHSLDSSQRSSSFDINEISENRCKEFSELIPSMLTFGSENLLYYFVQLENGDGIFLAPVLSSTNVKHDTIMNTFRKTSTLIHNTLQNTKRFRDLLSNDSNKVASTHRSLVAIKEQGMLMSVPKETTPSERIEFWVLGRLFNTPPRELYVCHRADAPQNMIELAFRICLTCAG
ncbi:protein inturned [Topomyia yanbarensis]|uniref:protein inturned n=1 Tax=Topomyia yanbarensis TaxID=2498891 RepID=UPI00273AA814|nr:protein inturned [Topomyia yanbarensis]XP_058831782.1 protein inturned [Topomyia yanbarensis]XP_058831783.1 protein inturned [Topomyia yanbarensis]XP_058831785.1 protein inturned [Topomyia yanbarensis]XP_058831786.1 protein inturned [Topomyia yanbarensis]